MAVNGRRKGAAFERTVAKLICETYGVERKHCYRTPLSGGHIHASKKDPGDLVISSRLRKMGFKYSVECKFYRRLDWNMLMTRRKKKSHWTTWWAQACKASSDKNPPLLVVRENRRKELFAVLKDAPPWSTPSITTRLNGDSVRVIRFQDLLKSIGPQGGSR